MQTVTGDINMLSLDPTAVRKTTLINAFTNYLVYNSLDEAIERLCQRSSYKREEMRNELTTAEKTKKSVT